MTGDEFKLLAKGMRAAYTQQNFLCDDESIKLWYGMLRDLDGALVSAAIYKHICQCKFPPTIAEIRAQCAELAMPVDGGWLEGWSAVQAAIGRYGMYRTEEALAALRERDPLAAEVAQMLGWQSLCQSENAVADRANFRTCYERKQERGKELMKLPEGLRTMISGVASTLALEGGAEA